MAGRQDNKKRGEKGGTGTKKGGKVLEDGKYIPKKKCIKTFLKGMWEGAFFEI